MPSDFPAIQTFRLTKRFPSGERLMGLLPARALGEPAVDGLDLAVRSGELFGLLGPNGAGKTTLVKMLTTLIVPTSGTANICGFPLEDEAGVKSTVGLVTTDERSFFWRLTGRQNLAFFGTLHGLADIEGRIERVLALVGMESQADRTFKEYSTGMRQRLAIARALLHRPNVLFLDEPTRGLDPPAIRSLHELIRGRLTREQGLTVLMTTHWLHEAESLCDRVAIMHHGRIRGIGTVSELRGLIGVTGQYRVQIEGRSAIKDWMPTGAQVEAGQLVHFPDSGNSLGEFIEAAGQVGERILSIEHDEAPLEAVFDRLTGSDTAGVGLVESGEPGLDVMGSGEAKSGQVGVGPMSQDMSGSDGEGSARSDSGETGPGLGEAAGAGAGHVLQPSIPTGAVSQASHRTAPGLLRVAGAFLRRDWQAERSYRLAFLLSVGGILFSAAVFYFVARLIDQAAAPYLQEYGGSYFAFVLLGIAIQRYFGVGLNSFASSFRQAQTTGTLEAMLTSPVPAWQIALSSSLWSYGLVSLQVLVYMLIGVGWLGVTVNVNLPALLLSAILGVAAFTGLGILSASFVMVLKRGDPITWAVGAVSTFFGGVYFPVDLLPGWLQPVSQLIPVTYGLRAIRLSVLQGAGIADLGVELAALAIFAAVLLPLGFAAFRYAMLRARQDGSLTHY